jgi:hypothetical protein
MRGAQNSGSLKMNIKSLRLKLLLALPVVVLVALPGEAKTSAQPAVTPAPQAVFGLLLDPYREPVLHIELPKAYRAI